MARIPWRSAVAERHGGIGGKRVSIRATGGERAMLAQPYVEEGTGKVHSQPKREREALFDWAKLLALILMILHHVHCETCMCSKRTNTQLTTCHAHYTRHATHHSSTTCQGPVLGGLVWMGSSSYFHGPDRTQPCAHVPTRSGVGQKPTGSVLAKTSRARRSHL